MEPPEIVLCIPGNWRTQSDLVKAIAQDGIDHPDDAYVYAGFVLHKIQTQEFYNLQIEEHNPNLSRSFRRAGQGRIDDQILAAIDAHTFVVYLIAPGGSPDAARRAMAAASALLRAGGLAVKVETSGRAEPPSDWFALQSAGDAGALYTAFVTTIASGDTTYTCGMQNLGARDSINSEGLAPKVAVPLFYNFLIYTLRTDRTVDSGHTFNLTDSTQVYQVQKEPCTTFPEDDYFYNPYGMWRITFLPEPTQPVLF